MTVKRNILKLSIIALAAQLTITAYATDTVDKVPFNNVSATVGNCKPNYCQIIAPIGLASQDVAGKYTFDSGFKINDGTVNSQMPYQSGSTLVLPVGENTFTPGENVTASFNIINNKMADQKYNITSANNLAAASYYNYNFSLRSTNDNSLINLSSKLGKQGAFTPVVSLNSNDTVSVDSPLYVFAPSSNTITKYPVYDLHANQPFYFSSDWNGLNADNASKTTRYNPIKLQLQNSKNNVAPKNIIIKPDPNAQDLDLTNKLLNDKLRYSVESSDSSYKLLGFTADSKFNVNIKVPKVAANLGIDNIHVKQGEDGCSDANGCSYKPVFGNGGNQITSTSSNQNIYLSFVPSSNAEAQGSILYHVTFPVDPDAQKNVADYFQLGGVKGSNTQVQPLILGNFNAGGLLVYLLQKQNTNNANFNLLGPNAVQSAINKMVSGHTNSWSYYDYTAGDTKNNAADQNVRQINYLFGTMFGQLLQENINTNDYFSSDKLSRDSIDSAADENILLGAGQGGPYQINDYAADFASTENALGLSSLYAIRGGLGFQPADDAEQMTSVNPDSLDDIYFAPLLTAYFHANDVMRLYNIAHPKKASVNPTFAQCLSNIQTGTWNYADMIMNAIYNGGPLNGFTSAMLNICGNDQDAGQISFDDTTNTAAAGIIDTYSRYPRQVHYYLDQLYGSDNEQDQSAAANTNHVYFSKSDLEQSLFKTIESLSRLNDAGTQLNMLSQDHAAVKTIIESNLNSNSMPSPDNGKQYDISNMHDRGAYLQALINIYTALDAKFNNMLTVNSQQSVKLPNAGDSSATTPVTYDVVVKDPQYNALPASCSVEVVAKDTNNDQYKQTLDLSKAETSSNWVHDIGVPATDSNGHKTINYRVAMQSMPAARDFNGGTYSVSATATNCGTFVPVVGTYIRTDSNVKIHGAKPQHIAIWMQDLSSVQNRYYLQAKTGSKYYSTYDLFNGRDNSVIPVSWGQTDPITVSQLTKVNLNNPNAATKVVDNPFTWGPPISVGAMNDFSKSAIYVDRLDNPPTPGPGPGPAPTPGGPCVKWHKKGLQYVQNACYIYKGMNFTAYYNDGMAQKQGGDISQCEFGQIPPAWQNAGKLRANYCYVPKGTPNPSVTGEMVSHVKGIGNINESKPSSVDGTINFTIHGGSPGQKYIIADSYNSPKPSHFIEYINGGDCVLSTESPTCSMTMMYINSSYPNDGDSSKVPFDLYLKEGGSQPIVSNAVTLNVVADPVSPSPPVPSQT